MDKKEKTPEGFSEVLTILCGYGISEKTLARVAAEYDCRHLKIERARYSKDLSIPRLLKLPYCKDCGREFAEDEIDVIPEQVKLKPGVC